MVVGLISSRAVLPGLRALTLGVLAWAAFFASAASDALLRDPTQPPEGMATPSAPGEPVVPVEPQLQSVLIGAAGRSAIIGGQRYKLGDRIGDARLVKISESEVVLAGTGGRRTMTLFPPVKKRVVEPQTTTAKRSSPGSH